jgi:hypothetical protein
MQISKSKPKKSQSCVPLRRPGIDSQHGGPLRLPYLSYWPARLQRLAESIPRNRFLSFTNVYKYGLCYPKSTFLFLEERRQISRDLEARRDQLEETKISHR